MNKIYDKLLFISALLIFVFATVYSFLGESELKNSNESYEGGSLSLNDGSDGLEMSIDLDLNLMPGKYIYFRDGDDNDSTVKAIISKVVYKRKSQMEIRLLDGSVQSGRLDSRENLELDINWKKSNQSIILSGNKKTRPLPIRVSSIVEIIGRGSYYVNGENDFSILRKLKPHFYQKTMRSRDVETFKSLLWKSSASISLDSVFDVFTPPLIYLFENKLTTTLPKADVPMPESEIFGAEILSFEYVPYRFVLKSWIGNTPYLEDTKMSSKLGKSVRNRIEIGKFYRYKKKKKIGQPSLVPTLESDQNKSFIMHSFEIKEMQQKTGGRQMAGVGEVEHFSLGSKKFLISSASPEAWAGEYEFKIRYKLKNLDAEEILYSQAEIGKSINYHDRIYKIQSVDPAQKKIVISKLIPSSSELEIVEFLAP